MCWNVSLWPDLTPAKVHPDPVPDVGMQEPVQREEVAVQVLGRVLHAVVVAEGVGQGLLPRFGYVRIA